MPLVSPNNELAQECTLYYTPLMVPRSALVVLCYTLSAYDYDDEKVPQ